MVDRHAACRNVPCFGRMPTAVEKIRALMGERGWNVTDLSRELERVSDRFSESWRVSADRWLNKGTPPTADHAEALGAAFGVSAAEFLPAQVTQAELGRLEESREYWERRAAEEAGRAAEAAAALTAALQGQRHPQEMPKPGSRTRRNG